MALGFLAVEPKINNGNQQVGQVMAQRVLGAIQSASQSTGVDFSYLMNKAAQESSFNPTAKAPTSSATGLFQFTEQTWLRTVAEYGGKHGLGGLSQHIEMRSGKAFVADKAMKAQILEMRNNPEAAASMAAELARENQSNLENNVGGKIGSTELYLAHFLGAGGASEFLNALKANPNATAAQILPEAAAANRGVFYGVNGKAKTVAEIYSRFATKMAQAPAMPTAVGDYKSDVAELKLAAHNVVGSAPNLPLLNMAQQASPSLESFTRPMLIGTQQAVRQSEQKLAYTIESPKTPIQNISSENLYTTMLLAQLEKGANTFMPAQSSAKPEKQHDERWSEQNGGFA